MSREGRGLSGVLEAFVSHKRALRRLVGRYLRTAPDDIDDIVQEVFLRSYSAELKTPIQSPRAFLYQTARNVALNYLSQKSGRATGSLDELDLDELHPAALVEERSPESHALYHQQFVIFCKATERLPAQCRRAFILRKIYGFSHKEIAAELGISVSTVEKHLITGFSRCRQYINASEGGIDMTGRAARDGHE